MQNERLKLVRAEVQQEDEVKEQLATAGFEQRDEGSLLFSAERSQVHLIVVLRQQRVIGRIIVDDVTPQRRSAEIKIHIDRPGDRGQGYGTEALTLLCRSLEQRGYSSLYLRVSADNHPAIRCYEKVGFRKTAVLHEHSLQDAPIILMEYSGPLSSQTAR